MNAAKPETMSAEERLAEICRVSIPKTKSDSIDDEVRPGRR